MPRYIFLAAIPNALILERLEDDWPGRAQTVIPHPKAVDGFIAVPNAPGLGVEIDEDFVARHPSMGNVSVPASAENNDYLPGTLGEHVYVQTRLVAAPSAGASPSLDASSSSTGREQAGPPSSSCRARGRWRSTTSTSRRGAARLTTRRRCLYDRAGTGWSGPAELPRSATEVTDGSPPCSARPACSPILFVGHSLGGGYAWHYAQRFPAEVAGPLLLDPLHAGQSKYWPEGPGRAGSSSSHGEDGTAATNDRGLPRPLLQEKFRSWPDPVREALVARTRGVARRDLRSDSLDTVVAELAAGGPCRMCPSW